MNPDEADNELDKKFDEVYGTQNNPAKCYGKITIDFKDETVQWILGRPNFVTGPMAHVLREGGQDIPRKMEAEQAAVMIWMLTMYQQHGAEWRVKGDEYLKSIIATSKETKL